MTYRLAVPPIAKVFILGIVILFSILALTLMIAGIVQRDGGTIACGIFFAVMVSVWWWMITGVTYRIEYNGPGDITFISLRRTVRTSAMEIQSLKGSINGNFYALSYQGGRFNLLIQFTGFYQLLTEIKAANPAFETYGI